MAEDEAEVDLERLDEAIGDKRATRQTSGATPSSLHASSSRHRSHHRHHHHHHPHQHARPRSGDLTRRVQLVLFVGFLIVGAMLVLRACSENSRRAEPAEQGQGQGRIGTPQVPGAEGHVPGAVPSAAC